LRLIGSIRGQQQHADIWRYIFFFKNAIAAKGGMAQVAQW